MEPKQNLIKTKSQDGGVTENPSKPEKLPTAPSAGASKVKKVKMSEGPAKKPFLPAKDVVQLRFVHSKSDVSARGASGLHAADLTSVPSYLHQIIPDEEVHGYKSARVTIYVHLASLTYWVDSSLEPLDDDLHDSHGLDDDNDEDGAMEVTDVEGLIAPFIKAGLTTSRPAFISAMHNAPPSLPLTNQVMKYTVGKETFGVYKHRLFAPGAKNSSEDGEKEGTGTYGFGPLVKQERFHEFHRRMAFLMFIQIDGASFIDDEDPRWEVFVVAKLSDDDAQLPVTFVGYATTYPFAVMHRPRSHVPILDQSSAEDAGAMNNTLEPSGIVTFVDRIRISQVAIVPLFQRQGHGGRLVNAIYEDAHTRGAYEITVEDPSKGFRMLRDVIDLQWAYREKVLSANEPISLGDEPTLKMKLHDRLLITPGQARRCLEVHQLRFIDTEDEAAYKRYRLWVKRRLYHEKEDVLERSDAAERKERLGQLYEDTESEYSISAKRVTRYVEESNNRKRKKPDS